MCGILEEKRALAAMIEAAECLEAIRKLDLLTEEDTDAVDDEENRELSKSSV